jgi:hypothetical protein
MRILAGILAFLAVVLIAVVILANEWVKGKKGTLK